MPAFRLGLLSTANINRMVLAGAARSDRIDVVAIASRDAARAQAYAHDHGIVRAHGGYEALFADPEVDGVYVSLPNGLHHEWSMRALAAGKHVLCEKPYSRRPAEVEEAFDLAEQNGLVLMEAFMYRHHPQTRLVADVVQGGAIGTVRLIRTSFSFQLDDLTNVRARPELEGGALMDVGCYCVSGARLLAGEPEEVSGWQRLGSTGVDMSFAGVLAFPNGVCALIDASFELPARQRLEAYGSEGTIVVEAPWRVDLGGDAWLHRNGSAERLDVPEADSYQQELENLAAVASGEDEHLLGRADALGQARAIEALYRSAESGVTVALS
jgi:D-xylose 1-dehydrogenase (NADP+, D-xylono-1,5-lactone-forming)